MRARGLKFGLVAASALSVMVPLLAVQPAYADYAPGPGDIVGVGSDTIQYALDFVADGDGYQGDAGFNSTEDTNRLVSIDATVDANGRAAYGPVGNSLTGCSPGTGAGVGTEGTTFTTSAGPCVLNPTVVLRAGTQPVQRPNGSGPGIKALDADVAAGNNFPSGANAEVINFSRASAAQSPAIGFGLDSVQIGTDTLPLIASAGTGAAGSSTAPTNAPVHGLSQAQLKGLYDSTSCQTWNQTDSAYTAPADDPTAGSEDIIPILPPAGSGTYNAWLEAVDNVTSSSLITTPTNPCVVTGEENDPTAIYTASVPSGAVASGSTVPADTIEPVANSRLGLYQGTNDSFGRPTAENGYFQDPSVPYLDGTGKTTSGGNSTGSGSVTQEVTALGSGYTGSGPGGDYGPNVNTFTGSGTLTVVSASSFTATGKVQVETTSGLAVLSYTGKTSSTFTGVKVTPAPGAVTSGFIVGTTVGTGQVTQSTNTYLDESVLPAVQELTGTNAFVPVRPLLIYFRDSDLYSTAQFEPGVSENWVNTLFYDPCLSGESGCTSGPSVTETINGTTYTAGTQANWYGPDGAPFIDAAGNRALLVDSGITPVDTDGPWADVTTAAGVGQNGTSPSAFTLGGA